MPKEQQVQLQTWLSEYADTFAMGHITVRTKIVTHRVETGNAALIKQRPHRMAPAAPQQVRRSGQQMLAAKETQPADSSWGANPSIVRKKDGSARVCIDYRPLSRLHARTPTHYQGLMKCLGS